MDSSLNVETELLGHGPSSEKDGSGTISYLRGISGSGGSFLFVESWLEFGKFFFSSSGSDSLILINNNILPVSVLILNFGSHWGNLGLELSSLHGIESFLLRPSTELVLFFSSDTEFLGNVVRSNSHAHQTVSSVFHFEDVVRENVRFE